MSFIIVVLCLALLIVLISYFKVDAFIAFLISSILAGIALGIPLEKLPDSVNNGIGSILGGLTLIIVLGAMLGKLVAESGAAQKIASVMVSLFGTKHIQWGLMVTGFVAKSVQILPWHCQHFHRLAGHRFVPVNTPICIQIAAVMLSNQRS